MNECVRQRQKGDGHASQHDRPHHPAEVPNPATHPFVVEGAGENALKIYFENEDNKRAYLDIATEHPGKDFTTNLNNPV